MPRPEHAWHQPAVYPTPLPLAGGINPKEPGVNPIKHLLFILRQRRAGNRVSFSAYLKGHDAIVLGTGCKIHADASVDASRSPGVHFGDRVTLNISV